MNVLLAIQATISGGVFLDKTQMIKGILEGCILKIVSKQYYYSQEIIAILHENGFEHISEGTLFPLLLRLDKEGYFETKLISSKVGPSRKYYQLSHSGRIALCQFISEWKRLKNDVDLIMMEDDNIEKPCVSDR